MQEAAVRRTAQVRQTIVPLGLCKKMFYNRFHDNQAPDG